MSVHTIFVPRGWSVEQVWQHIKDGVPVNADEDTEGVWVNVDDKGKVIGP